MLEESFLKFWETFNLPPSSQILLACSGGLDSMCLAHLMEKCSIPYALFHANYGLRGGDSQQDQALVQQWAQQHGVTLFLLDAAAALQERLQQGENLQQAARQLRYAEMRRLLQLHGFSRIATAHHAQDRLEGLFISLLRGEEAAKLAGFPPDNGITIRPLYSFTKQQLAEYARFNQLEWREDASNQTDDYLRNRIRHQFIPFFEQERPSWPKQLNRFQEEIGLLNNLRESHYEDWIQTHLQQEAEGWKLARRAFTKIEQLHLQTWLRNLVQDPQLHLPDLPETGSGQHFHFGAYEWQVERDHHFLRKRPATSIQSAPINGPKGSLSLPNGSLTWEKLDAEGLVFQKDRMLAYLDADKAKGEWLVRSYQKGDKFRSIGMKGSKLLSDFFIDRKFSRREKEAVRLLTINGEIAWIIGHRIDARFAADSHSKQVFIAQYQETNPHE